MKENSLSHGSASRRAYAFAIVLVLAASPLVAAQSENDAGSGGDAPDAIWNPYPLQPGDYSGTLTPREEGADRDAYRVAAPMDRFASINATGKGVKFSCTPDPFMAPEPCGEGWYSVIIPPGEALYFALDPAAANLTLDYTIAVRHIQNDARSGGDAPDSPENALPLDRGVYSGMTDPAVGDDADWFVVEAPNPSTNAIVELAWEHDIVVRQPKNGTSFVFHQTAFLQIRDGDGPYVIGFQSPPGAAPSGYFVRFQYTMLLDLSVDSLSIRDVPMLGAPSWFYKSVEVVVTNHGSRAAFAEVVLTTHWQAVITGYSCTSTLPSAFVELEPGETLTLHLDWDTTGWSGDFEILAYTVLSQDHDPNWENDLASAWTRVGAGGPSICRP